MKRDLPRRMYRHGLGFRLHKEDGTKVNLGRDINAALTQYHVLTSPAQVILAQEPEVATAMWKRHQKGAKQRSIPFDITVEDVAIALESQRFLCAVTRLPFRNDKPPHLRIRPWAPSIDRIDARKGYLRGNVRVVCAFVNVAMNGFGEAFFNLVLDPLIERAVNERMIALGIVQESPISHGNPGSSHETSICA